MILSPSVSSNAVVPFCGTINELVLVYAFVKVLTVTLAFKVWLAVRPKVELAGVAKSTWKRQTCTAVWAMPPVEGLSIARRYSGVPTGGFEPVRKVAGTRL